MKSYERELNQLIDLYKKGDVKSIFGDKFANIVINGRKVIGINEIPGIKIKTNDIEDGIHVNVSIAEGVHINNPIHLCFGMTPAEGRQVIDSEFHVGEGAYAKFLSHCIFPNAKHIEHVMKSTVVLAKDAGMKYKEEHYHSESGGIVVIPELTAYLGENSRLIEEFKMLKGRAGNIDIKYLTEQDSNSSCQLLAKISGKKDDKIVIDETINLNGINASGISKSRVVLLDEATGIINSRVIAKEAYTRGHVDCEEIVGGEKVVAESVPRIKVMHPLAKVTHEASIGRIDKTKLETLMARGLEEDKAIEMIINGLMR